MNNHLKDKLNSIPIPDELDDRIEEGFRQAKNEEYTRKNRYKKSLIAIAASFAIVIGFMSLIGFDRVEAAIKKALQYIPGYNIVVESEDGSVMVLKEMVSYREDEMYLDITAAARLNKDFSISLKSDYLTHKDVEIRLQDENGSFFTPSSWYASGGGDFWIGNYHFELDEIEGGSNNYSLLLNDKEVPFTLEKGTQVEDFFQLGSHASDKGIDIVAIKKAQEDGLLISLLNQSLDKQVYDYPFKESLWLGSSIDDLGFEDTMYILDRQGNRIYPTIPSSFGQLMSDFYFDMEDQEGLKLVLPYMKISNYDLKTDKVKIKTPEDGQEVEINEDLALGDSTISILNVKGQAETISIGFEISNTDEIILDEFTVGGVNGYGIGPNEDTGELEIILNRESIGRNVNIFFESPYFLVLGDWVIDLD